MKLSRTGRILATAATIPALLLSTGSAALAATGTLTLTALNRAGTKVTISATAVDVDTSFGYTIKTGAAKKLPKGTYAVLARIVTGETTTLAGYTVNVSGAAKVTVDARQGKRVGVALSPAPDGLITQMSVRVCSLTGASYDVEAGGDQIYVVPTGSKKVGFAALGSWTDLSGTTDSYAVLNQTTGVPADPTRTYGPAALGTVLVESRRGPGGTNSSDIAVQPVAPGCGHRLFAELVSTDVPTVTRLRLSPTSWDIRSDEFATAKKTGESWDIGGYMTTRKVVAGQTTGARFYASAWGPGTLLPTMAAGRLSYNLNNGFEDPYYPGTGSNVEGGDRATAVLRFGSKVVATKKDTGWMPDTTFLSYKVKKAGWYTLTNSASRYYPEITYWPGILSTSSVATYRFQAKPKATALAPVYAVQMIPAGLSLYNKAGPASTTNVALKLTRKSGSELKAGKNPTVKTVTAQMSTNGTTWRSVPVRRTGGSWTAVVSNPSSGAVSLRARETNTDGSYTEVTIFRAYAIG
ncbi:hypothetical protein GCM10010172_52340 [Paractinoplanes ferrugineus]|uniref:Uncharacterized protein n=1 Tax=Paractinoplanes ferrugineus TaxID=113564 RepID=A0A919J217_9ACTN|nr:hypothetical protein [Actinoplanes ferrugineus]GIE11947.1 hypothetical protein Afe05nite_37870 [Actinoplanes ferrugineus]